MSDMMWHEATRDVEAEAHQVLLAKAQMATAPLRAFLLKASSEGEFEHRLALISADLERTLAKVTPSHQVRQAVLAGVKADFGSLHKTSKTAEWKHEPAQELDLGIGHYPADRWTLTRGEASAHIRATDPAAGVAPFRWSVDASPTNTTVDTGSAQSLDEAKAAAEAALNGLSTTASRKTSHMTREGVKFVLEINSEGDAMTGEANHELARILHEVSRKITHGDVEGKVRDFNGNTVGRWTRMGSRKTAKYEIKQEGGKYWVVDEDGNKRHKEGYDSKEKAREYQRALYANTKDASGANSKEASERGASATCPVCYRENVALRNGKLVTHQDTTREGNPQCDGTGKVASAKTAADEYPDTWQESFVNKETTTVDGLTVHTFRSTGDAYNQSQVSDDIKDGDVLAVPSEGVYGFLQEAWPIAVTSQTGEFHALAISVDEFLAKMPQYAKSVEVARGLASSSGHATASRKTAGDVNVDTDTLRQVSVRELQAGDKVFKPAAGAAYYTSTDGSVRSAMGIGLWGRTFTVKSNDGQTVVATWDDTGAEASQSIGEVDHKALLVEG